jgi:hypothetical protein
MPFTNWIYDTTHFPAAKMAVLIIEDLVSRVGHGVCVGGGTRTITPRSLLLTTEFPLDRQG